MAWTEITLNHPSHKGPRQAPIGFSWTTFFFSFFPALFRSDWKWGIIQFIIAFMTFGLSSFVFCFIYNKLYVKELLSQGYTSSLPDDVLGPVEVALGVKIIRLKND
tara:strand:- start:604 stop:921 length:318 start_codon:yes stop_codon:yes gene_type:complete